MVAFRMDPILQVILVVAAIALVGNVLAYALRDRAPRVSAAILSIIPFAADIAAKAIRAPKGARLEVVAGEVREQRGALLYATQQPNAVPWSALPDAEKERWRAKAAVLLSGFVLMFFSLGCAGSPPPDILAVYEVVKVSEPCYLATLESRDRACETETCRAEVAREELEFRQLVKQARGVICFVAGVGCVQK